MDAQDRSADALLNWLPAIQQTPHRYDFHTVLRCVESAYIHLPRLGESLSLAQDSIRLSQPPFLQFSGHAIDRFDASSSPAQLSSYLFGLFGPQGPLPIHITEYLHQCLTQKKEAAPTAFLNIFHHRLLSLYYRAWADTEPVVALDRPQKQRINHIVGSLSGYHPQGSENSHAEAFHDLAQCYYAGHLSQRHLTAEGLRSVLSHYFECRFDIDTFVPRWVDLPEQEGFYLNSPSVSSRQNPPVLGRSIQLGKRVRSAQQQLTLIAYPPNWSRFHDFLPGNGGFEQIKRIVQRYLGHSVDWRLQLRIERQHCQQWYLGQMGANQTMQLGRNQWLLSAPSNHSTPQAQNNTQVCVEFDPAMNARP